MGLVVSHDSALEYWLTVNNPRDFSDSRATLYENPTAGERSSGTNGVLTSHKKAIHRQPAGTSSEDKPDLQRIRLLTQDDSNPLSSPTHLLVSDTKSRFRRKGVICHVCATQLPRYSCIEIASGTSVVSPELCFIQMASGLEFPEIVELGYELCGTYRLSTRDHRGFNRADPLTSISSIKSFIARSGSLYGVSNARKALRHIIPDSASPMETVLAMLLSLPRRFGGYGLPAPQMNHRLEVGARSRVAAAKSHYLCDLYWPQARLAVEYDSDAFHTGSDRIADDASRRAALAFMGIQVVTVTKRQVFNLLELDRVVELLTKQLGIRLRIQKTDWRQEQRSLRSRLLGFARQ